MPGLQANPDLLLSSLLRVARRQGGTDAAASITWLEGIQNAARTGWQANDFYASSIGQEGSSTSWIREMSDAVLDNLCEAAIQKLEAEQAATDAGLTGTAPPGNLHYADFSGAPSTLG
jgi:hypothetical protein